MADVKHVFVLMLENRSFDHLLGFAALPGVSAPPAGAAVARDGKGGRVAITDDAEDRMPDIDHEYPAVRLQLHGAGKGDTDPVTMDGFFLSNGAEALRCFAAEAAATGVLRTLAREYCVFDAWFSSVPGPTWPNRFFVHAATSGGLDNSPGPLSALGSVTLSSLGYDFSAGSVYDWLDTSGLSWRIYHDDLLPQVLAIKGMPARFVDSADSHFRWLRTLEQDLASGDVAHYTFIEPSYDVVNGYRNGNSQHAAGSVSAGDALINWVYQRIRESPIWASSALLVLYDEHGGFYDHVVPPTVTPPGDDGRNHPRAAQPQNCAFDRAGVRVPAVLVSPWVPKATVVGRTQTGPIFEHSSVARSLADLFPALREALRQAGKTSLSARDGASASMAPLFSLAAARNDDTATYQMLRTLPAAVATADRVLDTAESMLGNTPLSGFLSGFTHLATAVELARREAAAPETSPADLVVGGMATEADAQTLIRTLAATHPKRGGAVS